MNDFTFLTENQIFDNEIEIIKKYGKKAPISDFAILLGGYVSNTYYTPEGDKLKDRTTWWWTSSPYDDDDVRGVSKGGNEYWDKTHKRNGSARPASSFSSIKHISPNRVRGYNGTEEIEYGEYPQTAVDKNLNSRLESIYKNGGMSETGKGYTTDSTRYQDAEQGFTPRRFTEYSYNGEKYIRFEVDGNGSGERLSNGVDISVGDIVWVKVEPIRRLIDEKNDIMLAKKGLFAGVRFDSASKYSGDFRRTEIKRFMDNHFAKDIVANISYSKTEMSEQERKEYEKAQKRAEKSKNPYGFNFQQVSEEEIIRGAIESGVPVFLHGPSSEGKSARVKQIDPTCDIIYLRNATPDSLNGKSVYDSAKGEMVDIPPTWLKKLQSKCEKEPDRLHVVFFDEITNALPSIQGIAFNIVLDREVNGIWQLPENARIVAAGNDMKDSLAANQLAEPLFNRFAHVYIKTTTQSWLKWASEHNIHPAIYSYIAFKNGETLRSEYNGETPNADPRKWEMASKMLYATNSPEMLRALVGEDITREFVGFCNQRVITLDDVIKGNCTTADINSLDTAQRYATTMGLSQVTEEHLDSVRGVVSQMGAEFCAVFDALWTHGDEARFERIQESNLALASTQRGGIRR